MANVAEVLAGLNTLGTWLDGFTETEPLYTLRLDAWF